METEAIKPKRKKWPLWLRIALGLVIAIFTLVAAGVALRFWITSDGGRAFIASQIDGRKLGPLGTIRIQGLKGDPFDAATVADITLVDDDGIWLRAKDARIEWTPTMLFAGELEIRAVNIRTVDILRAPRTTYQNDNAAAPDIGLRLDQISIEKLTIADNVIGPNASYRVAGGVAQGRDDSGFAKLALTPISGPADKANISAEWSATGALQGNATLSGPAGGLIAALTQAPADKAVTFDGKLDGTLQQFTGHAQLAFASETIATIDLSRAADKAQITADIAADNWPLLEPIAGRAGGAMKLSGQANLADIEKAPTTLRLVAPAGTIDVSTVVDFGNWALAAPLRTQTTNLDLALVAPPLTGTLEATGDLTLAGLTDFKFTGNAVVTRMTWPSGGAARIAAPVTVTKEASTIAWETASATIDGARIPALKAPPARLTAATRGQINLRTRVVDIYQSQVRGTPGEASARGTYGIDSGAMDFNGAVRVARLADIASVTGSARGQWSVRRASLNAPLRVTADMEGRDVSSSVPAIAELAGSSPRIKLAGVVRQGRFTVESGSIDGAGVRATMSGRIDDSSAIAANASGSLIRPLDASGVRLDALDFTADVTGEIDAPRVNLRVSDGEITTAGVTVRGVSGQADLRAGQTITGPFSLEGGAADRRLAVAGRIESGEGTWRIVNLNASLGDFRLTAPRLAYSDGAFSATFDARGPLGGIAGLERGMLAANGRVSLGANLDINVTGQLADLRSGQMRLDLIAFEATGSGNNATLKTHAVGKLGAPVDVTIEARGTRAGDIWTGGAKLTGKVDELDVKTAEDARWRYAPDGWTLDAKLTAFGGGLDLNLASRDSGASAAFELDGVNMRALSRLARITPIEGLVTGTASFSNGPGAATGDLTLAIIDTIPYGATGEKVKLTFTGNLRGSQLNAQVSGSGQGFSLEAHADTQMVVGRGFDLQPDQAAPLKADLKLTGRAEQLWALFGPDDQSLRGGLEANVQVAGTMAKPALTGGFTVSGGAYEHGETGLRLRDISARGEFDQRSARITGLTAQDGQGGSLTGGGGITWDEDFAGKVEISAANLRALGRDDRMAILSGDGSLTLDTDSIHVNGNFLVSQARISVEQPASAKIPTLPGLQRINFPNQREDELSAETPPWLRPVQLDLKISAPRRVVVFGRGLDTEWSANFHVTGPISDPSIDGTATLVRGDLSLAGKRFQFDTGTIDLDGPIRTARLDISAERSADDVTARVRVSGSPVEPKFVLESTPSLPQDEILARVLFGRSAGELSGFEAAQLAGGLAQLAGGQAGFDPVSLVRQATGLDRVAFGAEDGIATVSAGKYVADDVYLQVGAGGEGGVGAQVEWEPQKNVSIISSAQGNGDTKIAVRWKKDYGAPEAPPEPAPAAPSSPGQK